MDRKSIARPFRALARWREFTQGVVQRLTPFHFALGWYRSALQACMLVCDNRYAPKDSCVRASIPPVRETGRVLRKSACFLRICRV
jgi:hypothetical protein